MHWRLLGLDDALWISNIMISYDIIYNRQNISPILCIDSIVKTLVKYFYTWVRYASFIWLVAYAIHIFTRFMSSNVCSTIEFNVKYVYESN